MKEKELKYLSREELLELLLVQTKENEKLRQKLEKAEAELSERRIKIEKSGTLAEAVVGINGVMEAAQAAAQQYLDNAVRIEEETREKCRKILEDAEYEAVILKKKKSPDDVTSEIVKEICDFVEKK